MKRLFSLTLAMAVLGTWLVPTSAEAGLLQRLFGWRGANRNTVVQPAQTHPDSYRRGSYEPTVDGERNNSSSPSYRSNEPKKYPWEYSKSDSRRFSG
jgi:hypothetical protein